MQPSAFFALCMCASLLTCGASASLEEQAELTIKTEATPAPTRSFLYGPTSGLSLSAIQRMLMAGIVYRLREMYPFDKLAQETFGYMDMDMDMGATALSCTGESASTVAIDTLFHIYGEDFFYKKSRRVVHFTTCVYLCPISC